ncbi:MAG: Ribosomal large subunit pseudouridine synthase C [Chlamydiia bacterium]|nr:Ribosomal large subunit pseudouridine synthase C [Chlamydiia bacterium]
MSVNVHQFTVSDDEHGLSLQQVIRSRLGEIVSGKQIKRLIHDKYCQLNESIERFSSKKVRARDQVRLVISSSNASSLDILYEDEELYVVNKPVGLVCDEGCFDRLLPTSYFLVHRLDKETSGVLLVAKSERIRDRLMDQFREREVKKTYLAIIDGEIPSHQFEVSKPFGKVARFDGGSRWGSVKTPRAKVATTGFEVVSQKRGCALAKCMPKTGMTHQIRAHLSELGLPIRGDVLYHSVKSELGQRVLLHSLRTTFTHPISHRRLTFEAPIPNDFSQVMANENLTC